MVQSPSIAVRHLRKVYGEVVAVDDLSFAVPPGAVLGLLGGNGAGKTTTIAMLLGLLEPTAGDIEVLGVDMRRRRYAALPRMNFSSPYVDLPHRLTVRENLVIYGRYFGLSRREVRERAARLLDFVQLAERANDRVEPLSGGMKRRLTIARSLVNDPEVLLLDEPTTGLDPQARHVVWDRLFRLKQQGVTLVLTTHYMDEAEQLCDRLVVMDRGKIAEEGSPLDLIRRLSTREVVELRFAGETPSLDEQTFNGRVARIEKLPDRVLLYTEDGDALVPVAHERLKPQSVLVRRSTLEDVFLRLTGRTLVD
jgi:lipooligosaccharide transport system ATP-binding protein